jgi:hypothetical protein
MEIMEGSTSVRKKKKAKSNNPQEETFKTQNQ